MTEGELALEADLAEMGEDLLVAIRGGRAHVGAVAVAQPRPSLRDSSGMSATSSVFTMLGHKEDDLAKLVSEKVASHTGKVTVVVAGVHYDSLSASHVQLVMKMAGDLAGRIVAELNEEKK